MATHQTAPWTLLKPLAYTSTAFVGVNMAATSIIFIPALLRITANKSERPTTARLFASVNELSMKYNIPLEVLSMLSFGALAYKARAHDGWKGWVAAVGVLGSIFPLKNMLMAPCAKNIAREDVQGQELDDSLRTWSVLNLARSGIVLGAGVVAVVFGES